MARKNRHKNDDTPGTIYLNKNRYWWKVQLPGETKPAARPLKPVGSRYATTDRLVAVEVARNLYQDHIYVNDPSASVQQIDSIAALAAAYVQFCKGYYLDENRQVKPEVIDRLDKSVWHYTPEKHKNQHRNTERIVAIGPRGQEILTPYLLRVAESYCFSPAESETQRLKKRHPKRKTALSCGNRPGTNRMDNPQRTAGDRYDSSAYAKALQYAISACKKQRRAQAKAAGVDPKLIPH